MQAQKETPGLAVAELLAVQDVAIALEQETRDFSDDAFAVGAGKSQNQFGVIHLSRFFLIRKTVTNTREYLFKRRDRGSIINCQVS
jgi:hypothetical protein